MKTKFKLRDLNVRPLADFAAEWRNISMIEACMLWPKNERAQQDYLSAQHAQFLPNIFPVLSTTDSIVAHQMTADSQPWSNIERDAQVPRQKGEIAGMILLLAVMRIGRGAAGVALGSIIKELAKNILPARRLSAKTIENEVWPEFRCVAPYWAAFLDGQTRHGWNDWPFPDGSCNAFLDRADELRRDGERMRTARSPTTILRGGESILFTRDFGRSRPV